MRRIALITLTLAALMTAAGWAWSAALKTQGGSWAFQLGPVALRDSGGNSMSLQIGQFTSLGSTRRFGTSLILTGPGWVMLSFPYWLPLCLFAAYPAAALIRRQRRLGRRWRGRCVNCDYSLRGLTQPRCPECGEPITVLRWPSLRYGIRSALATMLMSLALGAAYAMIAFATSLAMHAYIGSSFGAGDWLSAMMHRGAAVLWRGLPAGLLWSLAAVPLLSRKPLKPAITVLLCVIASFAVQLGLNHGPFELMPLQLRPQEQTPNLLAPNLGVTGAFVLTAVVLWRVLPNRRPIMPLEPTPG